METEKTDKFNSDWNDFLLKDKELFNRGGMLKILNSDGKAMFKENFSHFEWIDENKIKIEKINNEGKKETQIILYSPNYLLILNTL